MKKIFLSILLIISIGAFSQTWNKLTNFTSENLLDVFCLNKDTVFVAGNNGAAFKSTNGGLNWSNLNLGIPGTTVSAIHFLNDDIGFAVTMAYTTTGGKILKTTNKGSTWSTTIPGTSTTSMYSIVENKNKLIVTSGTDGYIFVSNDTGKTWLPYKKGTSVLRDINFPAKNDTGFIVNQIGNVYRTTNNGQYWDTVNIPSPGSLMSIGLLSEETGCAVGLNGKIHRTNDRGDSWNIITPPSITDLYRVRFYNNTGYIVGNNAALWTSTNTGMSWETVTLNGVSSFLYDIQFCDSVIGYAVGGDGTVIKHELPTSVKENDFSYSIYPNPANTEITIEIKDLRYTGYDLEIYNLSGQELIKAQGIRHKAKVDVSDLPCGIYFIKLITDKTVEVRKIIKE
ncbi:MAG: YCF48-related protein [Bacteroidales bacterium]|nr:YCF48-related protein [Bacteroidales bacterium]